MVLSPRTCGYRGMIAFDLQCVGSADVQPVGEKGRLYGGDHAEAPASGALTTSPRDTSAQSQCTRVCSSAGLSKVLWVEAQPCLDPQGSRAASNTRTSDLGVPRWGGGSSAFLLAGPLDTPKPQSSDR